MINNNIQVSPCSSSKDDQNSNIDTQNIIELNKKTCQTFSVKIPDQSINDFADLTEEKNNLRRMDDEINEKIHSNIKEKSKFDNEMIGFLNHNQDDINSNEKFNTDIIPIKLAKISYNSIENISTFSPYEKSTKEVSTTDEINNFTQDKRTNQNQEIFEKPVIKLDNTEISNIESLFDYVRFGSVTFTICLIMCITFTVEFFYYYNSSETWTCILNNMGAKISSSIHKKYHYHRIITPIFIHSCYSDYLSNLITLIIAGFYLEWEIGHLKFGFLYLFSGLLGNTSSALFSPKKLTLGSSPSNFGLIGCLIIHFLFGYIQTNQNRKNIVKKSFFIFLLIFILIIGSILGDSLYFDWVGPLTGFISGVLLFPLTFKSKYKMVKENLIISYSRPVTYFNYFMTFILFLSEILMIILISQRSVPTFILC